MEKEKRRSRKYVRAALGIAAGVIIAGGVVGYTTVWPASQYKKAESSLKYGDYVNAEAIFRSLADRNYKDAEDRLLDVQYAYAKQLAKEGDYDQALDMLQELVELGYEDAGDDFKNCMYSKAEVLLKEQEYDSAGALFRQLAEQDYKDAAAKALLADYKIAERELSSGNYAKARELFQALTEEGYSVPEEQQNKADFEYANEEIENNEYEDAGTLLYELKTRGYDADQIERALYYRDAYAAYDDGRYEDAAEMFAELYFEDGSEVFLNYRSSADMAANALVGMYHYATELYNQGEYEAAKGQFKELQRFFDLAEDEDNSYVHIFKLYASKVTAEEGWVDSGRMVENCENAMLEETYQSAMDLFGQEKYEEAKQIFEELGDYSDSSEQAENCRSAILEKRYEAAVELYEKESYQEAGAAFEELADYKDSREKSEECRAVLFEEAYQQAVSLYEEGQTEEAVSALTALRSEAATEEEKAKLEEAIGKYQDEVIAEEIGGGRIDAAADFCSRYGITAYQEYCTALLCLAELDYPGADAAFARAGGLENAPELIREAFYTYSVDRLYKEDWNSLQKGHLKAMFEQLGDFRDSAELVQKFVPAFIGRRGSKGGYDYLLYNNDGQISHIESRTGNLFTTYDFHFDEKKHLTSYTVAESSSDYKPKELPLGTDELGRIVRLPDKIWENYAAELSYNEDGLLASSYQRNTATDEVIHSMVYTYEYDERGRVTKIITDATYSRLEPGHYESECSYRDDGLIEFKDYTNYYDVLFLEQGDSFDQTAAVNALLMF